MPAQFEFIFTNGTQKANNVDRSLIRRRGMQGKNRQEGSRRSMRHKREMEVALRHIAYSAPIIRPPPNDLALVPLVGDIGPRSQYLLYKTMTSNAVGFSMSPLELCVDFDLMRTDEFERVMSDQTFLNAVLFTGSAINDIATLSRQHPSEESSFHLHRTLLALNAQLDKKDAHCMESTILVVITLALLAAVFGDWTAAGAHISGLRRIIELCGGLKYLRQRSKLHYKIDRLDLSWTLGTGGRPRFLLDLISWDRIFKTRPLIGDLSLKMYGAQGFRNERLAVVYEDLQYLTVTINENVHKHVRWKGDCFQETMTCIQARLLQLVTELKRPFEEFMCLAMLACLTTAFRVPGRRMSYSYLAGRFREACYLMEANSPGRELEALELWGLTMGAISVFELADERRLVERGSILTRSLGMDWPNIQRQLRSVMWIECIHDDAGRSVFERLSS